MKNVLNFYWGLMLIFLSFSCNNGSSDSVKNAKKSNAAKIDSLKHTEHPTESPIVLTKADANFLVNAASGHMKEVQLGQLAQTNSTNQRIKEFGAMIVKDHETGNEKLKALAASKNVTLPDSISNQQQKEKEKLQKKKGAKFDRAYIVMMMADHRKDILEFEKKANNAADSSIKAFATDNLPILNKHLDSAKNLQKLLGIIDRDPTDPVLPIH